MVPRRRSIYKAVLSKRNLREENRLKEQLREGQSVFTSNARAPGS